MSDERRLEPVNIRIRPSLRAAIEEDRRAKGHSLVEWAERAFSLALSNSTDANSRGEQSV